jgi:uncharacterized protein YcbX
MGQVAALWRHPIKSHGREALDGVTLTAGATMPWDRTWAVTHAQTKFNPGAPDWASSRNFMIGTLTPALVGLWAQLDTEAGQITLTHADRDPITFAPDLPADQARFLAWVAPLCPPERPQPTGIVKVPGRGMTDTSFPSVSLMNAASHAAVEGAMGGPLEAERWRGNIWIDGLDAWAEEGWIGKRVAVGAAVLEIVEKVGRCMHTAANPRSGRRDADTLGTLKAAFGHTDFGVYATVVQSGRVALGDRVRAL